MAELPVKDLARDWPLLVGNPAHPDRVVIVGFETQSGKPLDGCRVLLETPSGDIHRLETGETFHLQIQVRYTTEGKPITGL